MTGVVVGVLGGMGPAATTQFMARVQALTPAAGDEDHLRLIVDCNPRALDGDSPEVTLAAMARGLHAQGAELVVMPCNAAHAYADAITAATPLPFLNLIEAVADAAVADQPAAVGLLAADGCLEAGLYQDAFARRGVRLIIAEPDRQADFMGLIYRIKAGDLGATTRRAMGELAEDLVARGAEVVVAGCTEVPLVLAPADLAVPLADSIEILATRTVATALGG